MFVKTLTESQCVVAIVNCHSKIKSTGFLKKIDQALKTVQRLGHSRHYFSQVSGPPGYILLVALFGT